MTLSLVVEELGEWVTCCTKWLLGCSGCIRGLNNKPVLWLVYKRVIIFLIFLKQPLVIQSDIS